MTPGSDDLLASHWEGEPIHVWRALWDVPHLEVHEVVSSTNDRARVLALEGAPSFSTVLAEDQSAGRGRSGSSWISSPARGLLLSMVVRREAERGGLLTPLLAGLSVARALEEVAPEVEAELKWPNDVLIRGRKVCGILCEVGSEDAVVLGVGINISYRREDFPADLEGRATSLAIEAGKRISRGGMVTSLMRHLKVLLAEAPAALPPGVVDEIRSRDALLGRKVELDSGLAGVALGIDPAGRLQVEDSKGTVHRAVAGSVRLR